jgi:hypothetical protein
MGPRQGYRGAEVSDADVVAYIEALEEPRRGQLERLHRLISEEAPGVEPKLRDYSGSLIGYGTYHYKGRSTEGDWFWLGVAPRKAYVSLYSMAQDPGGGYYAESFAPRIGVKSGKSCLNIKDPNAIDEALLREFVRESVRLLRELGAPNQT